MTLKESTVQMNYTSDLSFTQVSYQLRVFYVKTMYENGNIFTDNNVVKTIPVYTDQRTMT